MKKILLTSIAFICFLSANAQKTDTLKNGNVDNKIFTSIEHVPELPVA